MIIAVLTKKLRPRPKVGRVLPNTPEASYGEWQFKVFAILWAIATLFHMAHSSIFDAQLNLALLTLSAFLVIFRPSLHAFFLLVVLQAFDAFYRMPMTTNHWIFTAFANFTVLQVAVYLIIRDRTFQLGERKFFNTFAPLLRIEVIILYFFAVFHKINSGFFTSATSCATELLQAQSIGDIIPLTDSVYRLNAYLTVLIELSIPIMLCFSRTRNAGILIGLFFHCILSYSTYNAFYDFSSVMFASYFLFIDPGFSKKVYELFIGLKTWLKQTFETFSIKKMAIIGLVALIAVGIVYVLTVKLNSFKSVHLYFFWTLYSIVFTMTFVIYIWSQRGYEKDNRTAVWNFHWSLYLMPLVVFLNGTMPYLGLKTENSYAMFSNLRTEGGRTNHFLVPASVQVFNYQKDVVEIISSSDKNLEQLGQEGKALVLFEFRNYVNDKKPERVEYRINGEPKLLIKGDEGAYAALGKNPYVLRKLMRFRPFSPNGPQECAH